MGAGKFDGLSHNELYAMVADANPSQLTEMGSALNEASMELNAISDLLRHHVERVKWEGEGGDAFREWGGEMVKQAAKLADYTVFAGSYIGQAGDGLSEVKSAMPKPDPTAECLTDPEKEQARLKVTESHRQEAINLMNKLDSYYRVAHEGLAGLEEPAFRPMPFGGYDDLEERPYGDTPSPVAGGVAGDRGTPLSAPSLGAESGTQALGAPAAYSAVTASPPSATVAHSAAGAYPVERAADWTTGTGLDSTVVAAQPAPVTTPRHAVQLPDTLGHASGIGLPPAPPAPGIALPHVPPVGAGGGAIGPVGGAGGRGAGGGTPLPRTGRAPWVGASDGVVGGTPARPGSRVGAPQLPRGTVVGDERGLTSRAPMGMGAHAGAIGGSGPSSQRLAPGRRLASEAGGVVGRPSGPDNGQSSVPGLRLPRGTVVGAEHNASGGGLPGNSAAGRRVASEPGGAAAAPHSQWRERADFTSGGSGLVRENQLPGVPHAGGTAPGAPRRRAVSRPDYLAEDQETWTGTRRDTVPPVIQ